MNKYLNEEYNRLCDMLSNVEEELRWHENNFDEPEELPTYLDLIEERDNLKAQISNIYDG